MRDGNRLLAECTATIGAIVDYCYGYVDAIADHLFQGQAMGEFTACVSTAPDDAELRYVVVRFLRENPALRRLNAPELIARALAENYRCPPRAR